MKRILSQRGVSLVEAMVMMLLMSVVLTAGSMVFIAGQSAFSYVYVRSDTQENSRRALQRISFELQESGRDSSAVMKVAVLDGVGVNGSDVLRFSVPLCVCGISPIDSSGNVSRWGAPSDWGRAGCSTSYPVDVNGKVDICHYPPGNPDNPQDLNVSVNAVRAHLAHGDYLGICDSCDPNSYANKTVEYRLDSNRQLLRRVLAADNSVISSTVMAQHVSDLQATINGGQTAVTVTVSTTGTATQNRTITFTNSMNVPLRNRG